MSGGVAGFSKGRIRFIPNNQQRGEREYSDRSVIELRELDFPNCTLRGIDIAKNSEEIFNIPLKKKKQYKKGGSNNIPDEIRSNDGTYRLWLNETSRDGFYKELGKYFKQLRVMSGEDDTSDESHEDNDSHQSIRNSDDSDHDIPTEPGKADSSVVSPKDLLLDVHQLSKYIEEGAAKAAGQIASQLASKGVRLRATSSVKNAQNEKEFTISVQLDGNEYGIDQHGATIPVDVFQSTTVRELRAAFELAYQYRPSSQYFFVNGCLAHDDLSMKDLKVGPNSLFVLFHLTHLKSFQNTGPWRCSACRANNQPNNLRCASCTAARNE